MILFTIKIKIKSQIVNYSIIKPILKLKSVIKPLNRQQLYIFINKTKLYLCWIDNNYVT